MSLLKSIGKLIKTAAPIAAAVLPFTPAAPFAPIVGAIAAGTSRARGMPVPTTSVSGFLPSLPAVGGAVARVLPGLGAAGAVAGVAVRGASAIARSAATYCRRHPTWCATIGGVAAVEGLVRSGQLPPIKRRRRRGISGRELSSFCRVAGVLKRYGPTASRSRCPRRKRCP